MLNHILTNNKYELLHILQYKFYDCIITGILKYLGYLIKIDNLHILNHIEKNQQVMIERKTLVILDYLKKICIENLNLNLCVSYFHCMCIQYDIIDYDISIYDGNFREHLDYFADNHDINIQWVFRLPPSYNGFRNNMNDSMRINIQLIYHKYILLIIVAIEKNNLNLFKYFINVLEYISFYTSISSKLNIFSWVIASNNGKMLEYLVDINYLEDKLITNEKYVDLNIFEENNDLYIDMAPKVLDLVNDKYQIYKIDTNNCKKVIIRKDIIDILKKYYTSLFGNIKDVNKNMQKHNKKYNYLIKISFIKERIESIKCSIFSNIYKKNTNLINKMEEITTSQLKKKKIKRGYSQFDKYLRKFSSKNNLKKYKKFYNPNLCEFIKDYEELFNIFNTILNNEFNNSKIIINFNEKKKTIKKYLTKIDKLKPLIEKYKQLSVCRILSFKHEIDKKYLSGTKLINRKKKQHHNKRQKKKKSSKLKYSKNLLSKAINSSINS